MLRTRILTASILGCLLLMGLFLLPPTGSVLAFGGVFTIGAWEGAGFGALRAAPARAAYALGIALLLLLGWMWSRRPMHLLIVWGAAGGLIRVSLVGWGGALYFGLRPLTLVIFGCAVGVHSIIGALAEGMFQ